MSSNYIQPPKRRKHHHLPEGRMVNWLALLMAIAAVEDGGRNIYQIEQIYLDDVNRIAETNYTMEEVLGSTFLQRWVVIRYLRHYGDESMGYYSLARIHNGGPNGCKKESTKDYAQRVTNIAKEIEDERMRLP